MFTCTCIYLYLYIYICLYFQIFNYISLQYIHNIKLFHYRWYCYLKTSMCFFQTPCEAWRCPTSREEMQPTVCAKQVVISESRKSLNVLGTRGTTMGTHVIPSFLGATSPIYWGFTTFIFYGFGGPGELIPGSGILSCFFGLW